jgi:hypothetical protein
VLLQLVTFLIRRSRATLIKSSRISRFSFLVTCQISTAGSRRRLIRGGKEEKRGEADETGGGRDREGDELIVQVLAPGQKKGNNFRQR